MKKYILVSALILAAGNLLAQNEYDALRYSQTYIQGTARSAAMGGAFGALGGDVSCMSINPAGVGVYSDGELSVSLEFLSNNSKVTPTTGVSEDSKYSMKIPSMGFVIGSGTGATQGYTGWAFGVGFNRLNDFSLRESFNYENSSNSLLDSWCDRANGLPKDELSNFNTGLGFDVYLIDTLSSGVYTNPHHSDWGADKAGYGQRQKYRVDQRGGINCWDFSFAGRFNEMFFLGASLGIQTVNFKTTNVYSEYDINDKCAIDYFDFTENNKVYGAGVNLKLGLIYKPIDYVRIGAAIHTPTVYSLTDRYYTKMKVDYDPGVMDDDSYNISSEKLSGISEDNEYKYVLVTPFKSVLSAAFVYPGYGMISFDYESVNYSKCKLRNEEFDDYDFEVENQACRDKYKSTSNFRVGVEGLAGPVSIRAGYALYGNPLKYVSGDKERQIVSGGIGLHLSSSTYFDITATYNIYQSSSYIYESQNDSHSLLMSHDNRYLHVMATLGFKF